MAKIIHIFQLSGIQLLLDATTSPCMPICCNVQLIKSKGLADFIRNVNGGNFQQVAASAESSRFCTDI